MSNPNICQTYPCTVGEGESENFGKTEISASAIALIVFSIILILIFALILAAYFYISWKDNKITTE